MALAKLCMGIESEMFLSKNESDAGDNSRIGEK
jgi:hypothetical protein